MPRLGLGSIDISSLGGTGQDVVTAIDDFFFESNASGEMHPILTTSRTNLVTSSEDFTSGWSKDDVTISANSTTAPDGTSTADKIIGNTNSSRHNIVDTGLTNTVTASISIHAKAGELRYLQVASANTANQYANFDLLTGTIGNIGSDFANVAMDSLANGWYRITLTSVNKYNNFYLSLVSGLTASWLESWSMSNDTDGLFLWGAQLEEDGFASAYIPTSGSTVTVSTTLNDTSEVWDFDSTDIMLEADPEDEGFWEEGSNLVLNHDYEELGSNLVTNGTFDSDANWTKYTGWSIANGKASCDGSQSGNSELVQQNGIKGVTLNIVNGKTYEVTLDVVVQAGAISQVEVGGTYATDDMTSTGTYTRTITASSTNKRLTITANSTFEGSVDNVTVKQVDPNDRWTLGTGWSIEDGKLKSVNGVNYATYQQILTSGTTYEITYTISDYSSGTFGIRAQTQAGITVTANGTYTDHVTSNGTRLYFMGFENFNGSVDNVTVREYAVQPKDI